MNVIWHPSPNVDDRHEGQLITSVVLHYTGMRTGEEALARLRSAAAKVSAHYLIDEDGKIYQLVRDEQRAWHAGTSFWRGETSLNNSSIGIELVNPGHEFGYRPFPSAQIARLEQLLDHVWKQYHLKRDALLAHSDIAPSRKQDPGELFPWHDFAQKGFGLWPKFVESAAAPDLYQATRMLADIGYDCGAEYDQRLRFALLAFQRRYQPRSISGNPEPTTLALVKGLWLAWQEYHRA